MLNSVIVQKLMFDYELMDEEAIKRLCSDLPKKIIRWIGINHPDNRTRKIFFRLTNVEVGEDSVINSNFVVSDGYLPLLKIGNRVAISPNVTVVCESGPNNSKIQEIKVVKEKIIKKEKVTIGDDCWIGANVTILPGVNIGNNSIVGAGAVVTKDIPPYAVAAGIPAKIVMRLNEKS